MSKTTIAIDGPAASGKTTVGHSLADCLGYLFLDTGCMYRTVTLAALQQQIDLRDEPAIESLAEALDLEILPAGDACDGRMYTVLLDGNDVTWEIRSAAVDLNVSLVSSYQGVRRELVRRQRQIASRGQVVVVGRDIGTVVLPGAPIKLYIVASAEERARRRWSERARRGDTNSYEEILEDIIRRDGFDGRRRYSPMRPAEDAIIVDTTDRSPEEVLSEVLALEAFKDLSEK